MKVKTKNIYELELFEESVLHQNDAVWESVKRVPGGWLYHYTNTKTTTSCFIPFNNEFQK